LSEKEPDMRLSEVMIELVKAVNNTMRLTALKCNLIRVGAIDYLCFASLETRIAC
jgi:hypothetical protein